MLWLCFPNSSLSQGLQDIVEGPRSLLRGLRAILMATNLQTVPCGCKACAVRSATHVDSARERLETTHAIVLALLWVARAANALRGKRRIIEREL